MKVDFFRIGTGKQYFTYIVLCIFTFSFSLSFLYKPQSPHTFSSHHQPLKLFLLLLPQISYLLRSLFLSISLSLSLNIYIYIYIICFDQMINMEHKAFLPVLLMLFLGFSLVFSSAAVPASRSLKSFKDDPSIHDLLAQGEMEMGSKGEISDVEQVFIEGRMVIANTDYPGTGANNHHDPPKPPGRF